MPKFRVIYRYPELGETVVDANNIDAAELIALEELSQDLDPSITSAEIEIEMIEEIDG